MILNLCLPALSADRPDLKQAEVKIYFKLIHYSIFKSVLLSRFFLIFATLYGQGNYPYLGSLQKLNNEF